MKPAIARRTDPHGHVETREARRWYKLAEWQALRKRVFLRDGYRCQLAVECDGAVTVRPVADHKIPHRGQRALFFCEANVWTLCKRCHDVAKQREEAAERTRGGYA